MRFLLPEGLLPLERAVLELFLQRPGEPFATAAAQLAHMVAAERKITGVGFFRHFSLPDTAPVGRDLPNATPGGIHCAHPSLKVGAGFLLFIRGGVVAFLEGFTYDDDWPSDETGFIVSDTERQPIT